MHDISNIEFYAVFSILPEDPKVILYLPVLAAGGKQNSLESYVRVDATYYMVPVLVPYLRWVARTTNLASQACLWSLWTSDYTFLCQPIVRKDTLLLLVVLGAVCPARESSTIKQTQNGSSCWWKFNKKAKRLNWDTVPFIFVENGEYQFL
jgi:hypothetical protein